MIYLISGNDDYQKAKRLLELKKLFRSNDFNVCTFDGETNFFKIKAEAETLPFLTNEKQIIIYNISKVKDKKIQSEIVDWLSDLPKHLEVVLFEDSLSEKNWLLTILRKIAKIEIYNSLKSYQISTWIKKTVLTKGGEIDASSAEKLSSMLGNDLWRLDNEIQKLITYNPKITLENINNLVEGDFLETIFSLMDALSEKKEDKALLLLNNFMSDEENALYLLTMVARQIRNLLSIKELSHKRLSEGEIAKSLNLHPFVVKNTLRQINNFTILQLLTIHERLVETDNNIKTSQTDSKVVMAQFVHQLCI